MMMEFSKHVRDGWNQDRQQYNDQYYRDRIAEIIMYRAFEANLVKEAWYVVGFKAIIASYSIAKLSLEISKLDRVVDLGQIWRSQCPSPTALTSLLEIGKTMFSAMNELKDERNANLTQLVKRQVFWEDVKSVRVSLPGIASFTVSKGDLEPERKEARKLRGMDDGIEAQSAVVQLGSQFWINLNAWLDSKGQVASLDRAALSLVATNGGLPSEKQARRLLLLKAQAEKNGFFAT
jgi:hypothetical protein